MSTRPALIRGQRSHHWSIRDGTLVLRNPRGFLGTEVPVSHLTHPDFETLHVARLRQRRWVPEEAILELIEIARGAVE